MSLSSSQKLWRANLWLRRVFAATLLINIVQYFDVISIILPKQKALAEAAELLAAATTKVEQLNAIVAELQAQLGEKEAEYNKAMGEKNAAEAEANRCQMRLGLAQRLVNALGSENDC